MQEAIRYEDKEVQRPVLFASFNGMNIFEMFKDSHASYKAIVEHVQKQIEDEAPEIETDLIRVGNVLLKRNIKLNDDKNGQTVTSLVTDLIAEPSKRDMLLKIGRHCPNYSILNSLFEQ